MKEILERHGIPATERHGVHPLMNVTVTILTVARADVARANLILHSQLDGKVPPFEWTVRAKRSKQG